jgi:hypothetical protein
MKSTLLILPLFAATCMAQPAPVGVDHLSPDDVTKAVSELKSSFVRPDALSDQNLASATLQGLLDRLAPEVALVSGSGGNPAAAPFYSEVYNGAGYLRIGALTMENIEKAHDVLKAWSGTQVPAVILDLRGTPPSSDFETAAAFEQDFCAKGTEMFHLVQSKAAANGRPFSSGADPLFTGILVVLVDETTAEAPEALAASLQECTKALVVGAPTAGRAFEYQDTPLSSGAVLRMAVAEVLLPDGKQLGAGGLKPDISVPPGPESRADLVQSVSIHGIASVVQEHDRPHLNEAALVSGSNPEVDEIEAEQSGVAPAQPSIDRQLEQALDLVISIEIYKSKGPRTSQTGE